MTTYVIETSQDGTATLSMDGGEAQQVESVMAACEAIEQMEGGEEAGEPMGATEDADEAAAFGQAAMANEMPLRKAPVRPKMGMRGM